MPKVMSELGVEGWLHTELSLNQLNSSKHLISGYCFLSQAPDKCLVPCPEIVKFARGVGSGGWRTIWKTVRRQEETENVSKTQESWSGEMV